MREASGIGQAPDASAMHGSPKKLPHSPTRRASRSRGQRNSIVVGAGGRETWVHRSSSHGARFGGSSNARASFIAPWQVPPVATRTDSDESSESASGGPPGPPKKALLRSNTPALMPSAYAGKDELTASGDTDSTAIAKGVPSTGRLIASVDPFSAGSRRHGSSRHHARRPSAASSMSSGVLAQGNLFDPRHIEAMDIQNPFLVSHIVAQMQATRAEV